MTPADCKKLSPDTVYGFTWLPDTCAYRCVAEGRALEWWHPLVSGDPGAAITTLKKGLALKPGALALNLALAQLYYAENDKGQAADYFAKVQTSSPSIAERFGYLGESGGSVARAGITQDVPLMWDSGEE